MLGKRQPLSTLPTRNVMYFTSNGHCLIFIRICVESNQETNIRSSVKDIQALFDNIYLIFFYDVLDEHSLKKGL